ncbi:MAG: hypothetical protein AB7U79_02330 [Candidatus Izemoplasmatales bacterium]
MFKGNQLLKAFRLLLFILFLSIFTVGCEKTTTTTETTTSSLSTSFDSDRNYITSIQETVYLEVNTKTFDPLTYIILGTFDQSITLDDVILSGSVDIAKLGEYTITYKVVIDGHLLSTWVKFIVRDTVLPTIQFSERSSDYEYLVGSNINYLSLIIALDDNYKTLTVDDVEVVNYADTTTPGDYSVTYKITDKAGNYRSYTKSFKIVPLTSSTILNQQYNIELYDFVALDNGNMMFVARILNIVQVIVFEEDTVVFSMTEDLMSDQFFQIDEINSNQILISVTSEYYVYPYTYIYVYDVASHEATYFMNGSVYVISGNEDQYSERSYYYLILTGDNAVYLLNADLSLDLLFELEDIFFIESIEYVENLDDTAIDVFVFNLQSFMGMYNTLVIDLTNGILVERIDSATKNDVDVEVWDNHIFVLSAYDSVNPSYLSIWDTEHTSNFGSMLISYQLSTIGEDHIIQYWVKFEDINCVLTLDSEYHPIGSYTIEGEATVEFDNQGNAYVFKYNSVGIDIIQKDGSVTSVSTDFGQIIYDLYSDEVVSFYDGDTVYIYDQGELTTFETSVSYLEIIKIDSSVSATSYLLYSDPIDNHTTIAILNKETGESSEFVLDTYFTMTYLDHVESYYLFLSYGNQNTYLYLIDVDNQTVQMVNLSYSFNELNQVTMNVSGDQVIICSTKGLYVALLNDFENPLVNVKFEKEANFINLVMDINTVNGYDLLMMEVPSSIRNQTDVVTYYGNIEDGLDSMLRHFMAFMKYDYLVIQPAEEGPIIYLFDPSSFQLCPVSLDTNTRVETAIDKNRVWFTRSYFDGTYQLTFFEANIYDGYLFELQPR